MKKDRGERKREKNMRGRTRAREKERNDKVKNDVPRRAFSIGLKALFH